MRPLPSAKPGPFLHTLHTIAHTFTTQRPLCTHAYFPVVLLLIRSLGLAGRERQWNASSTAVGASTRDRLATSPAFGILTFVLVCVTRRLQAACQPPARYQAGPCACYTLPSSEDLPVSHRLCPIAHAFSEELIGWYCFFLCLSEPPVRPNRAVLTILFLA